MRHLFVMLLVGVLGFGLAVDYAEARRLGGGSSIGNVSRSASPPTTAKATQGQTPNQAAGTSRGRGMGGMLGGLLAGACWPPCSSAALSMNCA